MILDQKSTFFYFLKTYGFLKLETVRDENDNWTNEHKTDTCAIWRSFFIGLIISFIIIVVCGFVLGVLVFAPIAELVAQYHVGFHGIGDFQMVSLIVFAVVGGLFAITFGLPKAKKVISDKIPEVAIESIKAKMEGICVEVKIK